MSGKGTSFLEIYQVYYNESFPLIDTTINYSKYKKPWMTPALYKSLTTKSKLYKKYVKNPTPDKKKKFNKYNNNFKTIRE